MEATDEHDKVKNFAEELRQELGRELLLKSAAAAPGFFMCAVFITYTHLDSLLYVNTITALGVALMILAITRYLIQYLYNHQVLKLFNAVRILKFNIIINAFVLTSALIIPIIEFKFTNFISAIEIVSLIIAFGLGSVITLSYNLSIAFTFQWALLIPTCTYLFYIANIEKNTAALYSGNILLIGIIYMIGQTLDAHKQVKQRLENSIELENSYKLIKEKQDLLLAETAKLQQATKHAVIGEISGQVAHEINNPLTIIRGNIELILARLPYLGSETDAIRTKLQKALTAIIRITKIVGGLRNLSKNTENDPFVKFEISDLIMETVDFCSEKIIFNNISVKFDNSRKFFIFGKPIEISQVILNILSNGIDALSHSVNDVREINIDVSSAQNFTKISISNNGEKIRPEIALKIFDPHFTTKDNRIGMGLGLNISKQIIMAHQGNFYFDQEALDTTFVIELPKQT